MRRQQLLLQLVAAGWSRENADRLADEADKTHSALDTMTCPNCNGRVSRELDPRQAGPKPHGTRWYKYRCPCGLMVDRPESAVRVVK